MIPGDFDYHCPSTLDEAVHLLTQFGDEAKILAGGQSLIPAMRFRLAMPENIIDINHVSELDYIEERGGYLAIGALAREIELERSALIKERYPLLYQTGKVVADPVVRTRATIGGNVAHADPANDHPATMLAYNATMVGFGPEGERLIPVDEFFVGLFENALRPNEILKEIRIPFPEAGTGGAYVKIERKVGDYAISAAAVQLRMDKNMCLEARIGLTNIAPVSMRARNAEKMLIGNLVTEEVLEGIGVAAAEECDPSPDLRGGVEYKRDLTRVVTKRAVSKAIRQSGVKQ